MGGAETRERRWAGARPPALVIAAGVIVAATIVCAVFGEAIAPMNAYAQDLLSGSQPPSLDHPLGTDDSGRDVFSRIIVGARSAVVGPTLAALGALLIGTCLGLAAGYRGGLIDSMVMRSADIMGAFPALLVMLVLVGVVGGGYAMAIVILVVLMSPLDARVVRGAALEQRGLPYVDAARSMGLAPVVIAVRHILPNVLPLLIVQVLLGFASALVALSALSFLGFGVPPGSPDWGRMLSESLPLVELNPLAVLAPGAALAAVAVSVNLIGDWLHERMTERASER